MASTNEILIATARWHEAKAEHNMKRPRIRDRHLRIAESLRWQIRPEPKKED